MLSFERADVFKKLAGIEDNHGPHPCYHRLWPCSLPCLGERRFYGRTRFPPRQPLECCDSRLFGWPGAAGRACTDLERALSLLSRSYMGRNCGIGGSHRIDRVLFSALDWADGDYRPGFRRAHSCHPGHIQCIYSKAAQLATTWWFSAGSGRNRVDIAPRTSEGTSKGARAGFAGRVWLRLLLYFGEPRQPRCYLLASGGCTPDIGPLFTGYDATSAAEDSTQNDRCSADSIGGNIRCHRQCLFCALGACRTA